MITDEYGYTILPLELRVTGGHLKMLKRGFHTSDAAVVRIALWISENNKTVPELLDLCRAGLMSYVRGGDNFLKVKITSEGLALLGYDDQ